jgi:hypothetical protein
MDAQFHDQHAVERAVEQHGHHPHAHLEQRQAQQARQRDIGAGRIGKGQQVSATRLHRWARGMRAAISGAPVPGRGKCRTRW